MGDRLLHLLTGCFPSALAAAVGVWVLREIRKINDAHATEVSRLNAEDADERRRAAEEFHARYDEQIARKRADYEWFLREFREAQRDESDWWKGE